VEPVPARKPLPSTEVEICRRVRLVREAARFSRPVFGRFLGLDSSKVSNIEHCRIALDYITGNSLCRIFRVSAAWLVTGNGRPTEVLIDSVYAPIAGASPRTAFSEAYPELQRRVIQAQKTLSDQTKAIVRHIEQREVFDLSPTGLERSWQESAHHTGAAERAEIDAKLMTAVFGSPFNVEFENELAIVSGFDDKQAMRDVVAPSDLVSQLQQLTHERGAKSKLARLLKVSRQRLNEWLSGRSKPSARYLLLLLNWMRHQRQKSQREATQKGEDFPKIANPNKKSAPEARKHDRRKRPERKITKNEKPSSDRKKK
jgi:transcriptional regulator with XRE-family HTH domain